MNFLIFRYFSRFFFNFNEFNSIYFELNSLSNIILLHTDMAFDMVREKRGASPHGSV